MVFVLPLANEKRRNWGIFNTIARFTNERSEEWYIIGDNQKRFIPHLDIDNDFFIAHL